MQGPDEDVEPHDLLLPSQQQRLINYRKRSSTMKNKWLHPDGATFVYDLDHNPLKRPRVCCCHANQLGGVSHGNPKQCKGSLLCMISHGCVWHDGFKRPLSSSEWCQLHGYPTEAGFAASLDFPLDFGTLLKDMVVNPVETMSMMGNGWHLPSVGAWIMWAFSSIESLEEITGSPKPSLVSPCTATEVDEEWWMDKGAPPAVVKSPPLARMSSPNMKTVHTPPPLASRGTPLKMACLTIDISDSESEASPMASIDSI